MCQPDFCVTVALWLPWDCVCHGLLSSCAKSLSAAFNFQDASLMFIARRIKRSLESSSCHVRAVVDQIEFISLFSLQLFHNFTVLDRVAGRLMCTCQSQHLLKGNQEQKKVKKKVKQPNQLGFSGVFHAFRTPLFLPLFQTARSMAGQGMHEAWLISPSRAAHLSGQVFAALEMVSVLSAAAFTQL